MEQVLQRADDMPVWWRLALHNRAAQPAAAVPGRQHSARVPRRRVKTVLLRHLYMKTNILPRQARDKHRENSQKKGRFFLRKPWQCPAIGGVDGVGEGGVHQGQHATFSRTGRGHASRLQFRGRLHPRQERCERQGRKTILYLAFVACCLFVSFADSSSCCAGQSHAAVIVQASASAAAAAAVGGAGDATTPSGLEMPLLSFGSTFFKSKTATQEDPHSQGGLTSWSKRNLDLCWELKFGGVCTWRRVHSMSELAHEVFSVVNLISCCFA